MKKILSSIIVICIFMFSLTACATTTPADQNSVPNNTAPPENNEIEQIQEVAPSTSDLVGNVFQIIGEDMGGLPIVSGSAFVYNEEGWFVTNAHVMELAYTAKAIFEIKDEETGKSFTTLDIDLSAYNNRSVDIFVGKISGYSKIANYYKPIKFCEDFDIGETTYSVGYPNSVANMEVNKGKVIKDFSLLEDKLFSGVSYVGSDSFIAHGSSGGVLMNGKGEVLGITTLGFMDKNNVFKYGAAISAFNVNKIIEDVEQLDETEISDNLAEFLHPEEQGMMKLYEDMLQEKTEPEEVGTVTIDDEEMPQIVLEKLVVAEGIEDSIAYSKETSFVVTSAGVISYGKDTYYANGDRSISILQGIYDKQNKLANYHYVFLYEFGSSGEFYVVTSNDLYYSTNLDLTLKNREVKVSSEEVVSQIDIDKAKVDFNNSYEFLRDKLEQYYLI